MAAAEARAAWQRTANRYFVQEDAKRAPKLACCQSSTSSSKQAEAGPGSAADAPDHRTVGCMPFNKSPAHANLPPDAKWWLQMQPNNGHQRGLNFQQFADRAADMETTSPVTMDKDFTAMSEESIQDIDFKDLESFIDVKKHSESTIEELNVFDNSKVDQDYLDVKNMTDYYDFLEMEMVGSSVSKQTSGFSSKSDSSWTAGEKTPWWRVTDGEELASFVAHKSLHLVENCDLPPPQIKHVSREAYKPAKSIDHDEIYMSSLEWEAHGDAISSPSFGGLQRKHGSSVRGGLSQNETAASEPKSDMPEKGTLSDNDPCKAKLLEALCHSQTRAREAEKAAKQAYTEKEHILKLFFRQASQLFAYKQWLKMLQLENLLLQTDDDSPPVTALPDLLPWLSQKKVHKSWPKVVKAKRRRRDSQENEIGKYAVAFAVGFTLVGAGLILGWTVGWLLPAF
ncbi:putative polyketide synthase 10 [Bienertia sinuspersici]